MNKDIKQWHDRLPESARQLGTAASQVDYMKSEITDLRAYIAELEARTPADNEALRTEIQLRGHIHMLNDEIEALKEGRNPAAPVVAEGLYKLPDDFDPAAMLKHCVSNTECESMVGIAQVLQYLAKHPVAGLPAVAVNLSNGSATTWNAAPLADEIRGLKAPTDAQPPSNERDGWERAAKALAERAAGHHRRGHFSLEVEVRQCASMLHDMKPGANPAAKIVRDAAQPITDVSAEMRALRSACGGTGDVHRADGEYMGKCDCEAIDAAPTTTPKDES